MIWKRVKVLLTLAVLFKILAQHKLSNWTPLNKLMEHTHELRLTYTVSLAVGLSGLANQNLEPAPQQNRLATVYYKVIMKCSAIFQVWK